MTSKTVHLQMFYACIGDKNNIKGIFQLAVIHLKRGKRTEKLEKKSFFLARNGKNI